MSKHVAMCRENKSIPDEPSGSPGMLSFYQLWKLGLSHHIHFHKDVLFTIYIC